MEKEVEGKWSRKSASSSGFPAATWPRLFCPASADWRPERGSLKQAPVLIKRVLPCLGRWSVKATGINIEWGSPAGYCARGINRCFGGQIFARASTCTAWSCWGRRGVWCHVFWGYRLLKHTLIGMNSKPLKSCGMRSKLVSSARRQWYPSDPVAPQWPPTGLPECEVSISRVLAGRIAIEAYLWIFWGVQ